MKKILLLFSFLLAGDPAFAQDDSTRQVSFSGFADAYYAFDFNKPVTHERASFLYNHNRHNEFNVNLALLKATYTSEQVRGNLALMAGTYAQYNLAAEPEMLRNIFEANAGIRLSKESWLDAGVFPAHIGLENAVSTENITLTRSLAAENSPYYESGAKITYEAGNKWVFTGLILNGWQNIREPAGNSGKAIGTQIQFKPTAAITINSSTFIGNEKPDSVKQRRYFHDFYATFQLQPKLKLAVLFDIGAEKKRQANKYNIWYTPVFLLHYGFAAKLSAAARIEYYSDPNGVIINSGTPHGFRTSGFSLNLDYAPVNKVLLRIESRFFNSKDAIFIRGNQTSNKSTTVTTSMAISF